VVRSDLLDSGQVKTVADLKGRTIGAGPTKGAFNYIFTVEALQKGNVGESNANLQVLGFADSVAALANKALDAAVIVEPFIAQVTSRNIARLLLSASAVHPGGVGSILQYSPQFAGKKDEATKFMVAYLKGVRDYTDAFFANKDRDAVIQVLVQNTPIKDAKLWEAMGPLTVDVNGEFSVEDMIRQAEFHKKQGTLSGNIPDLTKVVDTSFIKAAVAQIGRR
jgi:NitT/TauT family transport system substrate-binding protein